MAPGLVNGKKGISQAEWDRATQFLKISVKPEYYAEIVVDDDLTTFELRTIFDSDNSGRITTNDAILGNYNCSLFKDAAAILALHGVSYIERFNPANIQCEKVPFFEDEKKLFSLLEKGNSPEAAKQFIQKIKDPACRERMAKLADRYFHTDEFSGSLKAAQSTVVPLELTLVRKKISQIMDKMRQIEADTNLPIDKKTKMLEQYENMLNDLRHAIAIL